MHYTDSQMIAKVGALLELNSSLIPLAEIAVALPDPMPFGGEI